MSPWASRPQRTRDDLVNNASWKGAISPICVAEIHRMPAEASVNRRHTDRKECLDSRGGAGGFVER